MKTQGKAKEKINFQELHNEKKFYFKLIIKIVILIVLISISIFLLRASFTADNLLSYTETGSIDYKVYLKENNFYKDKYLGKNMTYITSLVDYIAIDFNYDFETTEKSNLDYTYSVYANLVITPEDNSKVLFDEKYVLQDITSKKISNTNEYNIIKAVTLDYNYYNDLANTFKTTYGVNCNSKLIVGLLVDTNGKDIKYETEFNNSNEINVTFSLAKKQVDINMESANLDSTKDITIKSNGLIKNKGLLMVSIIFILATIMVMISIAKTVYNLRVQKDEYTRYIEKILNNYDRAIVETQYLPNLDDYEVIEINKFTELLDVRDTLRLPIIYTPIEGKGSCFYIRQDRTIYIHYVSCTSLVPVKKFDSLFM